MIKKIIMLLIPVLALIGGAAGGHFLKPKAPAAQASAHETGDHGDAGHDDGGHGDAAHSGAEHDTGGQDAHMAAAEDHSGGHGDSGHGGGAKAGGTVAWMAFPSQFFVPLVRNGDSGELIILTVSLETNSRELSALHDQEHRLRDTVLRQLLIVANTGGFDGNFTTEPRMRVLREKLLKAVQSQTGSVVTNVLIEDIARQRG